MFESLSEKLQSVFKKLRGRGGLTEDDVNEALREVRLVLLEADVNFKVVKDFVAAVKERAIGQDVLKGLNPAQQVIKIVNEEMIRAPRRRAGEAQDSGQAADRDNGRGSARRGQDHSGGQAREYAQEAGQASRCWWRETSTVRRRSSSSRRSASRSASMSSTSATSRTRWRSRRPR